MGVRLHLFKVMEIVREVLELAVPVRMCLSV